MTDAGCPVPWLVWNGDGNGMRFHMLEWGRPDGQGCDGSTIAGIRIKSKKSHLKWSVTYELQ
jgi:hypothetical protein